MRIFLCSTRYLSFTYEMHISGSMRRNMHIFNYDYYHVHIYLLHPMRVRTVHIHIDTNTSEPCTPQTNYNISDSGSMVL